ncbi:MAG: bla regulator protein BlaR1 [Roseivirga sp.]|jgi:bla regulator protein BlaR1
MINYITEASVCLACFYSIYWLFLRGEKLLSINRFYLLATALISLIIPLLSFEISLNLFEQNQSVNQTGFIEGLGARRHLPTETPLVSIGLVYSIGLAIATLLLAIKVIYAKKRIGQNISLKTKPIKITETDGLAAFSFLNTIFIGKDISKNKELKEHIIAHESAHIEGKHSLDLFFFEVMKCVFWFNPFSYLYCKSIKLQHEYIADQYALEMTSPASYQRSLLELTLSQVNSSLISNFNEHPIQHD